MKIAIIGTGYVGLVTGACFAEKGHDVFCMDVDEKKITDLQSGIISIFEPQLSELVAKNFDNQKLKFTTSMSEAVEKARLVFICVGTPSLEDGSADLQYIYQVADEIGQFLFEGAVIVLKSTVPVGTEKEVRKRVSSNVSALAELRRTSQSFSDGWQRPTSNISLASNPEFLGEGSAISDFMNPHRTIVGIDDDQLKPVFEELYSDFPGDLLFMTIASAMMTKYASNAFLATKISFINEIANICEELGANIVDVARGMSLDPRIGKYFLNAGIGYGGSCFPKDVRALYQIAGKHGHDFNLLKSVIEVNNNQRLRFFEKIKKELGELRGKKICVLGLAFKANTDDIRESIGIDLVQKFLEAGADVSVYDPKAMENAKQFLSDIRFADSIIDASVGADAVVIATEWPEFQEIDLNALKKVMNQKVIFDGRNILAPSQAEALGFRYFGVGR